MGLLKAFVCQVVILGSYKLFVEQAIEEYLPDEVARHCFIGSICLMCFGIQLYTDKPGDDESAEEDEIPKTKSEKTDANKFASRGVVSEKKMPPIEQQSVYTKEWNRILPEAEKVTEVRPEAVFDQSSNTFCTLSSDGILSRMGKLKDSVHASDWHETTTSAIVNGVEETNVHEESEEDDIEIDQFVYKTPTNAENVIEEAKKPLEVIEAEQVEQINAKFETEAKPSMTVEAELSKPKDATEAKPSMTAELSKPKDATEAKPSMTDATEAVANPERLISNGEVISSTLDSNQTTTLKIGESSKADMTNGITGEFLNNTSKTVKSKEPVTDMDDIRDKEEKILPSEPPNQGKSTDLTTLDQEVSIPSSKSISERVASDVETRDKNIADVSKSVKTVSSSSKKVTMSSSPQSSAAIVDVCVAPVTIDISFIYAIPFYC